jgi:hypothetical protein
LRSAIAAASAVSVRSVTRSRGLQRSGEVGRFFGERQVARRALDRAGQRGDVALNLSATGIGFANAARILAPPTGA